MDFNPFAYEWEGEPAPAQTPPSQPSKGDPTSSSPDKVPTTPKRKRDDNANDTKDHGTAPKRPSPLRQVHTPNTLHPSTPSNDNDGISKHTPAKHPHPSSEESTSKTVVKGIAGFNIASPGTIDVLDLASEELEDPFSLSPSQTTATLPPLFSPASTDFTFTPLKEMGSLEKTVTPATPTPVKEVSSIENLAAPATLTAGDDSSTAANGKDHFNKTNSEAAQHPTTATAAAPPPPRTNAPTTPNKPTRPTQPLSPHKPTKPTNPAPTLTATTQPPPPNTPLSTLHSTPQIAPQYIPTYASPTSPLKLHDPSTFTLSPPYWRRWPKTRYTRLAAHVQETIDLSAFALAEAISVEEAAHVFNAVVVGPLRDETGRMARGAERRVQDVFSVMREGKKWRVWRAGEDGVQVKGELAGVRPGVVMLVGEMGEGIEVRFKELCVRDREYVEEAVGEGEWRVLMREGEEGD